jgi:antitoxin (DNA-binding transcriptional repressor) of toxin-antitoxin stability system
MEKERVSRRDFIQYTSRYLKGEGVVITNRGVPEYELVAIEHKKEATVSTVSIEKVDRLSKYGCGECDRVVGQLHCKLHGRS